MARWPQKRCSPSEPSPGIPCTNRDLLVAALCRFFSIFVDVLNHALKDEQVRATMAGELDAIAVIPFACAANDFSTIENESHPRMGVHLTCPTAVLRLVVVRRPRPVCGVEDCARMDVES